MSKTIAAEAISAELDITVVILTGGGVDVDMLHRCIAASLAACSAASAATEVIVIDNASARDVSGSVAALFEEVTVLRFPTRVGFCTANNAAFRMSRGRYIVQLNDDTEVHIKAFARMLEFLDSNTKVGAVGPRLENVDGSLQVGYYARGLPTLADIAFHLLGINRIWPLNPVNRRHLLIDQQDVTREVEQPAGAALVYRRTALFALGLLDEDYTFAFDDVDVCRRMLDAGWKVFYLRESRVLHHGGITFKKLGSSLSEYTLNGILCYYSKHASRLRYVLVRLAMLAGLGLRVPATLLPRTGVAKVYFHYIGLVLASFLSAYNAQRISGCEPHIAQLATRRLEAKHG